MFAAYGGGLSGCRRAQIAYVSNRLPSELHSTAAAVVVFAPHAWPSGAPVVTQQPAWGDDWTSVNASADGWVGVNYAQGVLRVNEHVFSLPDRSRTLVVMADITNQVETRAIVTPRLPASPRTERFLGVRVLFGAIRSLIGGAAYVTRSEAWGEAICAIPAVDEFLTRYPTRVR